MIERKTSEEFGEKLVNDFANWAAGTNGYPYREPYKKEAMKKFGLTSKEFDKLLEITELSWIF